MVRYLHQRLFFYFYFGLLKRGGIKILRHGYMALRQSTDGNG